MVQKKLPSINSAHGSETRNIINELIKLFNGMGYTYEQALQKAQNVLTEAQRTNNMNKDVQAQVNKFISEFESTGETNLEIVQARGQSETLNERLDHGDVKIKQNYDVSKIGLTKNVKRPETTVVFISDDIKKEDYTILKPIFESRGVPCTVGAVTEWLDKPTYLTTEELTELQNDLGWEVASHSVNHYSAANISLEEEDYELRESKRILTEKGFKVNNFIYPNNATNNEVRRLVSKYYNYACYGNGLINTLPLTPFSLHRVAMGSYFDGGGTDPKYGDTTKFTSYYKAKVDEAIAEGKSLLIFMLHPAHADFNAEQQNYLKQTIDYVKTKGLDILTLDDAVAKMGNYLTAGNYNFEESEDYFIIDADGKVKSSYGQQFITRDKGINENTNYNYFADNYGVNSVIIKTGNDLSMSVGGGAGTLTTYIAFGLDFSYQIWEPFDSTDVYKRRCLTRETWSNFDLISDNKNIIRERDNNKYKSTSLIGEFPSNAITTTTINTAGAAGFPEGSSGTLITDKLTNSNGYPKQIYSLYASNKLYIRNVSTTGAWSNWDILSRNTPIERTVEIPTFSLPAGKIAYKSITVSQILSGSNILNVSPFTPIPGGILWSWSRDSSTTIKITFFNGLDSAVSIPGIQFNINQIIS